MPGFRKSGHIYLYREAIRWQCFPLTRYAAKQEEMLETGIIGLQQPTAGNSAKQEEMLETLARSRYNRQLLATQLNKGGDAGDSGITWLVETQATVGYKRTKQYVRGDAGDSGNTWMLEATAGNSQYMRGDVGDSSNRWLQETTSGDSATHEWDAGLWQHWVTRGNRWQLSNTREGMLETLTTPGCWWYLSKPWRGCWRLQQQLATRGNCW